MQLTLGNAVSIGIFLGLLIAFVVFQYDRIINKRIEQQIAKDSKTQKIIKEVKDAKQEEIRSSRDPATDWRAEVGAVRRAVNGNGSESGIRQASNPDQSSNRTIESSTNQTGSNSGTGSTYEQRRLIQTGVTSSPTGHKQKIKLHRPSDF